EWPVLALIGPLHAVLRLERRAPPEHIAAGTLLTAAGALPRTREVRLSVGQFRRRRVRIRRRRRAELRCHWRGRNTENDADNDCQYGRLHCNPHLPLLTGRLLH